MGKLGSIIATAVFIGAFALIVYYCCLNKRRRENLRSRASSLFRQNRAEPAPGDTCGTPGQPTHGHPQNQYPGGGYYPPNQTVPHSIVNPNPSFNANPYAQNYPVGPGYGHQTAPYPLGPPHMPVPITYDGMQQAAHSYPAPSAPPIITHPDDLPPPYSSIATPGQRY